MPSLDDLMKSGKAERLLQNQEALAELRDAPETQKVFEMLSRTTGGNLEQAAEQAAKGDASALAAAIRQVMNSPEGAKLLQRMKKVLG